MKALLAAAALLTGALATSSMPAEQQRVLRVCADPNNLPFSNERGEGFDNAIARVIAREMGAELEYVWWAQRRGFIRNTLGARACDLVFGVPTSSERALATRPYYRSTYVFVTPETLRPPITSIDDPRLRHLKVGVHLIGDDYTNTPPAHALARRGITDNVAGYLIYGDYRDPNPPARLVEAVADGDVDVAVVWGPLAGYFAERQRVPLRLTPVTPASDAGLPFVFEAAIGVRRGDDTLRAELDRILTRRHSEIRAILESYGVPAPAEGPQAAAR